MRASFDWTDPVVVVPAVALSLAGLVYCGHRLLGDALWRRWRRRQESASLCANEKGSHSVVNDGWLNAVQDELVAVMDGLQVEGLSSAQGLMRCSRCAGIVPAPMGPGGPDSFWAAFNSDGWITAWGFPQRQVGERVICKGCAETLEGGGLPYRLPNSRSRRRNACPNPSCELPDPEMTRSPDQPGPRSSQMVCGYCGTAGPEVITVTSSPNSLEMDLNDAAAARAWEELFPRQAVTGVVDVSIHDRLIIGKDGDPVAVIRGAKGLGSKKA